MPRSGPAGGNVVVGGGPPKGNSFNAAHRVRVHLMTSFTPHFARDPQTGAAPRDTLAGRTRRARVTIHHDRRHPSRPILPVIPRTDARAADARR